MTATTLTACFAVLLGLAVGSFLNVVAWRLPAGQSVLRPRSYCPGCGTPIRERHNVPVLGYLVLRGRCAACHSPISPQYPLVEALTAALYGLTAARVGLDWQLVPYLAGVAVLVVSGVWVVRAVRLRGTAATVWMALLAALAASLLVGDWRRSPAAVTATLVLALAAGAVGLRAAAA